MIRKNITIDKARKILGQKGTKLSDKQIETIVNTLYILSERIMNKAIMYD